MKHALPIKPEVIEMIWDVVLQLSVRTAHRRPVQLKAMQRFMDLTNMEL